ncbi:MAG TPA: EthD family reductase [Gammaproteobacteria bacterium]|nr:EthD family reductase [Gammaproteobacteria bacterium]
MVRLTVMYPQTADSTFDLDYYLTKHMPLARERLSTSGLTATHIDEGLGGGAPGEPAPYTVICTFTFETMDGLQGAMAAHGGELMGDIPNFTNVQPTLQVSQVRG